MRETQAIVIIDIDGTRRMLYNICADDNANIVKIFNYDNKQKKRTSKKEIRNP